MNLTGSAFQTRVADTNPINATGIIAIGHASQFAASVDAPTILPVPGQVWWKREERQLPLCSRTRARYAFFVVSTVTITPTHLLKLRLLVARHGEMDQARWWNTQGLLGPRGALVLQRGFPSTHFFVQARVVFRVAQMRCHELFDPPGCFTLWSLPAPLEDAFQEQWHNWLDDVDSWCPFFESLASHDGDLIRALRKHDLISEVQANAVGKLRRSAENRAVPLPGAHTPSDEILGLLAAAFSRGEVSSPAVPYARLEA